MEITVTGADEVARTFEVEEKAYKKKVNRLLTSEGTKLRTATRNKILGNNNIITGNLLNSVTKQKNYKYHLENPGNAKDSTKVYGKHKGTIKAGGRGFGPEVEGYAEKTAKKYNGRVRYLQEHKYSGPHTHLIEHGHRVVIHGTDTGKRTKAYKNYEESRGEYQSRWESACDKFVDELVRDFG